MGRSKAKRQVSWIAPKLPRRPGESQEKSELATGAESDWTAFPLSLDDSAASKFRARPLA